MYNPIQFLHFQRERTLEVKLHQMQQQILILILVTRHKLLKLPQYPQIPLQVLTKKKPNLRLWLSI